MEKIYYVCLNLDNPIVAWEVCRGRIISCDKIEDKSFNPLSFWYVEYLRRILSNTNTSKNETKLEIFRQQYFPKEVSRLKGLYLFESLETAKQAKVDWDMQGVIAEVILKNNEHITKVDAKWITENLPSLEESDWMMKYWSGQQYNEFPHWELIVSGELEIVDKKLIHEAYENVAIKWPASIPLLKLSIIASVLESELGHIVPIILEEQIGICEVTYIINMGDMNRSSFLQKLDKYLADNEIAKFYESSADFITPGLREYVFKFEFEDKESTSLIKI
ncbi:MAG: hypothetical protein WC022_00715 [Parcubacteria group bacterium]